ncbi:hypothetical protein [Ensifer aridi]|uniref:hypothetical protein n=1 Tax=Ensifer aridi TaxID=1708715 RepID=UPI0015E479E2|nr:hypothetical protein [Ensifer aridi]
MTALVADLAMTPTKSAPTIPTRELLSPPQGRAISYMGFAHLAAMVINTRSKDFARRL